jgi:hypothetical protein
VVRRKGPIDYVLPFLMLVGLGIILILGYQIWSNFDKQNKSDVYFYVPQGKARLLPYGTAAWDEAYSGTKLRLGDALKTSSLGRVVMEFFNGTVVRLGEDSAATLVDLVKETDHEEIVLKLDNGKLWVKGQKSPGVREARYEVRTAHMKVKAKGTVFEVESDSHETVRVLEGDVDVDILVKTNGQERVADTVQVGVGQELVLDEASLKAFESSLSPSVIMAIGEEFKDTPWFRWNMSEDESPTNFASTQASTMEHSSTSVPDSQEGQGSFAPVTSTEETSSTSNTQEVDESNNNNFGEGTPDITSPLTSTSTVTNGKSVLEGTVPAGTEKVIVESTVGGVTDSYTLSKFKKGETTWSYNVSEVIGNLKKGDNVYRVYAVDADGNKSDPATVTIVYEKEKVDITDALVAPAVTSFNGSSSSTVTTDVVKIVGSVKGAEKVVVNGYTLGAFQAGATSWSYSAKEALGNLKPGVNDYEVYAIDEEGNKSAVVKFTITYNKPAGSGTTTGGTTGTGTGSTTGTGTQQSGGSGSTQAPGF